MEVRALKSLPEAAQNAILIVTTAVLMALMAFGPASGELGEFVSDVATIAAGPVGGALIWSFTGHFRYALTWTVPLAIANAIAVFALPHPVGTGVLLFGVAVLGVMMFSSRAAEAWCWMVYRVVHRVRSGDQ